MTVFYFVYTKKWNKNKKDTNKNLNNTVPSNVAGDNNDNNINRSLSNSDPYIIDVSYITKSNNNENITDTTSIPITTTDITDVDIKGKNVATLSNEIETTIDKNMDISINEIDDDIIN